MNENRTLQQNNNHRNLQNGKLLYTYLIIITYYCHGLHFLIDCEECEFESSDKDEDTSDDDATASDDADDQCADDNNNVEPAVASLNRIIKKNLPQSEDEINSKNNDNDSSDNNYENDNNNNDPNNDDDDTSNIHIPIISGTSSLKNPRKRDQSLSGDVDNDGDDRRHSITRNPVPLSSSSSSSSHYILKKRKVIVPDDEHDDGARGSTTIIPIISTTSSAQKVDRVESNRLQTNHMSIFKNFQLIMIERVKFVHFKFIAPIYGEIENNFALTSSPSSSLAQDPNNSTGVDACQV